MIKFIEDLFFTTTITYNATLQGPQTSPTGVYHRNTGEQIGLQNKEGDLREENTGTDENDRSSLKYMELSVKEKSDEEIYPVSNSDKMKISGDSRTENEAIYSTEKDLTNTYDSDRFEQDIRYE